MPRFAVSPRLECRSENCNAVDGPRRPAAAGYVPEFQHRLVRNVVVGTADGSPLFANLSVGRGHD